jgi:pectinesterase
MPKNLIALVIGLALLSSVATLFADDNELTVAADGSAQFKTVQAAIDAVLPKNKTPVVIRIAPGRYAEHLMLPKDKPFITLTGDSKDRAAVWIGGPAMKLAPLEVRSAHTRIENLTIESTAGPTAGPMMALYVESKHVVVENCRILGWQDTLGVWNGALAWFHNDEIWGSVDFIYSGGTGVFDHCLITERRDTGGVVAAPSTPAKVPFGLVFLDCHLTKAPEAKNGPMSLMRPWFPDGQTAFIRCQMDDVTPTGWDKWDGREKTCRAAEYDSIDANGKPIDLSTRSPWVKRLTDAEAADYTLARLLNGWDPAATTTRMSTDAK